MNKKNHDYVMTMFMTLFCYDYVYDFDSLSIS